MALELHEVPTLGSNELYSQVLFAASKKKARGKEQDS